jgi:hypothetical protein
MSPGLAEVALRAGFLPPEACSFVGLVLLGNATAGRDEKMKMTSAAKYFGGRSGAVTTRGRRPSAFCLQSVKTFYTVPAARAEGTWKSKNRFK